MAREWILPGYGQIQEDGTKEYIVPHYGQFQEDQPASGDGGATTVPVLNLTIIITPGEIEAY